MAEATLAALETRGSFLSAYQRSEVQQLDPKLKVLVDQITSLAADVVQRPLCHKAPIFSFQYSDRLSLVHFRICSQVFGTTKALKNTVVSPLAYERQMLTFPVHLLACIRTESKA